MIAESRAWRVFCASLVLVLCGAVPIAYSNDDSVFQRLKYAKEVPALKAPRNKRERRLIKKASRWPVRDLLSGAPAGTPARKYVAKVVGHTRKPNLRLTARGFVPCVKHRKHKCVAIHADSCLVYHKRGEECEGMSVTIILDMSHKMVRLDRAVASGYRVHSHKDIMDLLAEAP